MKFLKALSQKKLAKAVVCGLVLSGSMFVGMGQAFAETYISGADKIGSDWFGDASKNVKITDTVPTTEYAEYMYGEIYGLFNDQDDSNITKGKVTIEGGIAANGVYGGYSNKGVAFENTVTVSGGFVNGNIYGGYSSSGEAHHNTVAISGNANVGSIHGGYSESGEAHHNAVKISGGTVSGENVFGGDSDTGNAHHNIVTIDGGTVTGYVYGGRSYTGEASDNTVNIAASIGSDTKEAEVCGGMSVTKTDNNNTVNLIGNGGKLEVVTGYENDKPIKETLENANRDIAVYGRIYGSYQKSSKGNTLNVAGKNTSVKSIENFQNLNFYIQDGLTYGDTMMNINYGYTIYIQDMKVGVIVEAKPKANEKDATLNTINLLKATHEMGKIELSGKLTKGTKENDGDYFIIVKDGVQLKLIDDKSFVNVSDDEKALVLSLAFAEPEPDPDPQPKPEPDPTTAIATPAAMPLFEAMDKNKNTLSAGIKNFCENLFVSAGGNTVEAKAANIKAAISGAYQASEVTGTTSTAVSVVNNVSNMTMSRMSLVDTGAGVSGGKGVGLMAADSGADVWARYVHGKDKADGINMDGGSADYSNSYNGFVVGADFKKVGKFQSGIAFSYVDGSGSNSFKDVMGATARYGHTDFHSYNFGYYGSVKNDDTNTMFDLSYGTTSSDSDTNGVGGAQSFSAKSKIFNAGVTAEKSFDVSGMKLVPYTGLRYMHVDGGEYTDSLGIHHRADKQNVFMLPVGFKLSKENKLSHDWTLTPKLDLSYTWNMGDTDNEMTVAVPGLEAKSNLGYTVMDKGSFMGVAGIEAQRKNWTYGVSYAYQKGSHQDSKKIIADIKLSF